jgi:hypothetical protein
VQGVKAAWRKRQKRRRELLPSGGGKHVFATPQVAMACGAAASHAGAAAAVTPSTPKCPANPLIQLRLGIICRCSPMMAGSPASALIRIECSPTHNKTAGGKRHLNAQISSFFFSTQRGVRANLGGSVVPALYRRHSPHQRSAKNSRQPQLRGKNVMILTLNLKDKLLQFSFKSLFIKVLQGYSASYSATSIYIYTDYNHIFIKSIKF